MSGAPTKDHAKPELYRKYVLCGLVVSIILHLMGISAFRTWEYFKKKNEQSVRIITRIQKYSELAPPPVISENNVPLPSPIVKPKIGIPRPVPEAKINPIHIFPDSVIRQSKELKGLSLPSPDISLPSKGNVKIEPDIEIKNTQRTTVKGDGLAHPIETPSFRKKTSSSLPDTTLPSIDRRLSSTIDKKESTRLFVGKFVLLEKVTIDMKYHQDWEALELTMGQCYKKSRILKDGNAINFQLENDVKGQLRYSAGRLSIHVDKIYSLMLLSNLQDLQLWVKKNCL